MKRRYFVLILGIVCFFVILIKVNADDVNVVVVEDDLCTLDVIDNGNNGPNGTRDIMVNINNIKPGKRISNFAVCIASSDCNNEENWEELQDQYVSPYITAVGNNDLTIALYVPSEKIKLRAVFVDFEPMDITYAKYNLETNNENEISHIYNDEALNINNYDLEHFNDVVTGYRGGDIILPSGCTDNGCVLKVTFTNDDYAAIMERLNDYNTNHNIEIEKNGFLELGSMNNHLETIMTDSVLPYNVNDELYLEDGEGTKSFYLFVNKFFYETNRSEFVVGDNQNRILSENYVGLKIRIDLKYFDEAEKFLTFTDYNNYEQNASIFYGTPKVQLIVDKIREVALTNTGNSDGMGTPKKAYTKIVSGDQENYPVDEKYELTIKSFYQQDYRVPLVLKDDEDADVQEITLELLRYAFGGNGNGLLLVDGNGINCRKVLDNPDCTGDNIYVSAEYRGLIDTFYTTGETTTVDSFEIRNREFGTEGLLLEDEIAYLRNEDFNPWAIAIFYHNEEIIETKSFELGELVKIEGFTEDVISNELVATAKNYEELAIEGYDSANYNIFYWGGGFEKNMNKIKYFNRGTYEGGRINHTLILASKNEIIDNKINRISLFLTNGELKADEANFPKLTYGVGEGLVFELDGRIFEELGGDE